MPKTYFNFRVQLAIPLLALLIGTPIFYFTNLDISISSHWFTAAGPGRWEMQSHPFWSFIYTYGVLLPIFAFVWGVITLLRSTLSGRPIDRLRAICVILAILIGPGIIVHGILKAHYPRPRPYDIEAFKGKSEFKKILVLGEDGKSFPSGHASAGFSLTIFFYLYYLKNRKKAWWLLSGAAVTAGLLSLGRILQGGHFSSDILWAFGLMQLVNVILFFKVLKIPEKEMQEAYWRRKKPLPSLKKKILINGVSVGFVLFIAFAFLLNRPLTYHYTEQKALSAMPQEIVLTGNLENEKLILYPTGAQTVGVNYWLLAHGLPYTTFEMKMEVRESPNRTVVNLDTHRYGLVRESRGHIGFYYPKTAKITLEIKTPPGKITRP